MRPNVLNRLTALGRDIASLCYPQACEACGEAAHADEMLCVSCAASFARLRNEPYCEQCGMSLTEAGGPCAYCLGKGVPHFDRVVRLGLFRDPIKRMIHRMKYHRRWPLAELLTDELMTRTEHVEALRSADVIVPVPLHPVRQIQRGYNQADLIARRLSRSMKVRVNTPIVRTRNTATQTGLHSHARRAENLRDAFGVESPAELTGRHIVIVDDVMTTGATMQSVARTIKTCKPSRLTAVVLAIADPRHNDFQSI